MKLYIRPFACSFSSRIAVYEAGLPAAIIEVDRNQRTTDGKDYLAIHPLGLVPALELGDARVLTENSAILQYIGERAPDRGLVPTDALQRARLQQWLSFIATELHKGFAPLLVDGVPAEVKAFAQQRLDAPLAYVAHHLADRRYLLDDYSVADPYLLAVLNWAQVTPVKLDRWPALPAFVARMMERPAVQRAFGEERELYVAALARGRA